jgi:peroxiredoxin
MPELSALHTELKPTGVQFLGIAIDSPKQVEAFAVRSPVSYPLVVAGMNGTELGRQFGNASGMLPFTVLIDRHGRILQRIPGRVRLPDLRSGIDALRRA